ncbi:hypothetical protein KSS87_002091 [Heliosperma pusillum]|nr:hypothetical protein KSS87_002091 [Heliosperma pusillum]
METLQNAYRDDDDDDVSEEMIPSPNPNLISDLDPNPPTTSSTAEPVIVPSTVASANSEPKPEPEPEPDVEPMVVKSTDNSATKAEQEDLTEALGSEAAEMAKALSSKVTGMAEALGSEDVVMAEALGSEAGEKSNPCEMTEVLGLEACGMAEGGSDASGMENALGKTTTDILGSETALIEESLGSERIGKVEALGLEASGKVEALAVEEMSSDSISESEHKNNNNNVVEIHESFEMKKSEGEDIEEEEEEEDDDETTMETPASKKQKSPTLDHLDAAINDNAGKKSSKKKSKSKSNSVWTKPTSRKGKKKAKNGGNNNNNNQSPPKAENEVLVTPMPRLPDKNDDNPEAKICLSKVCKAEKVELSEDRLSAGSCKGYRMVRATRGVSEGAWYFEIKVVHLGDSGHTRLGWSNERGDLQAPVGYDGNSFGYRDIDGSKVHKALREKYGEEGYKQGDVIGFYINLPEGESFAPKGPHLVLYKGQKYVCASNIKEDPPKCVPGSEILFFKNGVCQGVAFKDLYGGRYYPAASMYTLPNQPNCVVKFNFGPDFECFPADFEGRPVPRPMVEVSYHGYEDRVENGVLDENKQ